MRCGHTYASGSTTAGGISGGATTGVGAVGLEEFVRSVTTSDLSYLACWTRLRQTLHRDNTGFFRFLHLTNDSLSYHGWNRQVVVSATYHPTSGVVWPHVRMPGSQKLAGNSNRESCHTRLSRVTSWNSGHLKRHGCICRGLYSLLRPNTSYVVPHVQPSLVPSQWWCGLTFRWHHFARVYGDL